MPYLSAAANLHNAVALEMRDGRPLVGVCWAGNPSFANDYKRSVPLSVFGRLFDVPGVRFVSLQQYLRAGDEEILAGRDNIDLTSDRKSKGLAGTAALIAQLDLVITADTAIAHLAGALGRPVWILLAWSPYWVWLRGREDSPWYPTARLFRQPAIADWRSAVENAASELRRLK